MRPTKVLITATCIVGANILLSPFVTGRPPISMATRVLLLQMISALLNSVIFLVPAGGIWLAARKGSPTLCSVAIIVSCFSYIALWWLYVVWVCCE